MDSMQPRPSTCATDLQTCQVFVQYVHCTYVDNKRALAFQLKYNLNLPAVYQAQSFVSMVSFEEEAS